MSVGQTTIEELVVTPLRRAHAKAAVRALEPAATATLKGDARMARVLSRAVWSHLVAPTEGLVVPRGAARWRVPAYEVEETIAAMRGRDVRYGAGRAMLAQRLAHAVLVKMENAGDSPDDRVQDAVARSSAVRAYAGRLWPTVDPRTVLHRLLSDPTELARHARGVLSEQEQQTLLWDRPAASRATTRWSAADLALLDELSDLVERTASLGHVILDEAQDLSPMQLRAVGRRCATGSATVLGDIAQGTTPWATASWADALHHLGKPDGRVAVLDRGFRVPACVIDLAARLLPHMAPGLGPPRSVRESAGRLDLVDVPSPDLAPTVAATVLRLGDEPGSVGVICRDEDAPALSVALASAGLAHGVLGADHGDVEHRIDLVPATVAKGLEFDHVLVVEPAAIVAAEPDRRTGLRRLYVVLTRAVSSLTVVHATPLPPELAAP
jgi:DNA helicase IV